MSFQPYPNRAGFISLGIALIFGYLAIILLTNALQQNQPLEIFNTVVGLLLALSITGLTLYWTLLALKLNYHLNRNGLAIQWGLGKQQIPFKSIQAVIPGNSITVSPNFRGLNLGGLHFGWGGLAPYNALKFRTSAPVKQSLIIVTANESYVISPRQPDTFLKAWQARRELGPTQHWTTDIQRQWPLTIPIVVDKLALWLLAGGALLCLLLFGYISLYYPELPQAVPFHFDSFGQADRIADKIALFLLPAAGAIIWIANTVLGILIYRWEKVGTYLLWGITVNAQLCLWVAIFTITG